jgi:DNA-binding beta-propeller fold protein YncE
VGANTCARDPQICPAPDADLVLDPVQVAVPTGQLQRFTAAEPVVWRVEEAGGGAIDDDGLYDAPTTPGHYVIVATSVADPRRFDVAQVTVESWSAALSSGVLGGPGDRDGRIADARFDQPQKLAADGTSVVYIADCENNAIRRMVRGGTVTTIAGLAPRLASELPGDRSAGFVDGVASDARFSCPTGLALDAAAGVLYVADRDNSSVRQVELATGIVQRVAGDPSHPFKVIDGIGAAAGFFYPEALALDGQGHLYVAESAGQVVRRIDLATARVTTVAGAPNNAPADGVGTAAGFIRPSGLTWDPSGVLYVADVDTIRRFDPATGEVITIAGAIGAPEVKDGTGAAARFELASDLAIEGLGGLLVTELGDGGLIRRIDLGSLDVTTWVGGSATLRRSVDGPVASARIASPLGIAAQTKPPYQVFVSDGSVSAIRSVFQIGEVTTEAGWLPSDNATRAAGPLATDGTGRVFTGLASAVPASFPYEMPSALAVTSDGSTLYVAQGNAVYARAVHVHEDHSTTLDPAVLVAGNLTRSGHLDGAGPDALLDHPQGLALDGAGGLFVADRGSATVRRIELSTGEVTTLAGSADLTGTADGVGSAARFRGPAGLFYLPGALAMLYVADADAHTVRAIDLSTREVTTPFGAADQHGLRDGVGGDARFDYPAGFAGDSLGHLYIYDATTVRRVDLRSRIVRTFAGSGARGVAVGPLPASLNEPAGMAIAPGGSLVVSNVGETAVLRLGPD